jgi:hypothetical protein
MWHEAKSDHGIPVEPVPTDINSIVDHSQRLSIAGIRSRGHACIRKLHLKQLGVFIRLLLCVAVTPLAMGQVKIGTTLIVGYSKDKVIMAADSRVTHLDGRVEDDQCKIITLGNKLLFGTVGIEGFRSKTALIHSWEAVDEARRAFAQESVRRSGSIEMMSAYWARSIQGDLAEQVQYNPEAAIHSIETYGSVLIYGIFAGRNPDGNLTSFVVMVSCENKVDQIPCSADLIRKNQARLTVQKIDFPEPEPRVKFEAFGVSSTFLKFENSPEQLSAGDLKVWNSVPLRSAIKDPDAKRAVKFIDMTILRDPLKEGVGGDVDVVKLTRSDGVTWLHRKQNCPAD